MFKLASNRPLLPAVMIATLFVAVGCGDETTTPVSDNGAPPPIAVTPPMASYSAPGSNWNYDLNVDGSYSITRSEFPGMANDLTVNGSYQVTNSGFLSMSVDSADGTDAPSVSTQIWALEVPNFALLLGPVSTSDDKFIPMVVGGQCPGTDFSNNWITVRAQPSADATSATGSYFGTMSYKHQDGATSLESQYSLTNGNPDQGAVSLGNGYCTDGIVGTTTSDIYLAPEGSATVRANVDDANNEQLIFALPKATVGSIAGFDGSYAGVWSDDGASLDNKVSPIMVNCNSGICTGDFVTDINAGTMAGQTFVIDLSGSINVPAPGLTTGQLQLNGNDHSLGCMVDANLDNNGNRMISCAGQSPSRDYRLFNVILTSTD